jgi:hypothetical protein
MVDRMMTVEEFFALPDTAEKQELIRGELRVTPPAGGPRQWVIMASKELGLMPTTEGGLDFKLNMTHAIDGYSGLEHALPISPLFKDVRELFVKSGITYSPTLLVAYGGPFGENYYYTTENVAGDAKLRRFTPETEFDSKVRRRGTGAGGNSPGRAVGSSRRSTTSRSWPSSRVTSPVPAVVSASGHTDSCRDSATIGKCGRWLRAACRTTTCSAPPPR